MPHPLVKQLRFTRKEFRRALRTVSGEDARKRILPLNSLGWSVGHLAWQEQKYFLWFGQGLMPYPEIDKLFRSGAPASMPDIGEMFAVWQAITRQADPWLDGLTATDLSGPYTKGGATSGGRQLGALLQRVIYHYWYHTGENMAARKLLGHAPLPQFVGNIDDEAPYLAEASAP